jgi:hypothetical protein
MGGLFTTEAQRHRGGSEQEFGGEAAKIFFLRAISVSLRLCGSTLQDSK